METLTEKQDSAEIAKIGVDFHQNGNLIEAKSAFEQALLLDPSNLVSLYSIAAIHNSNGNFEQALCAIEKFLTIKNDFAMAYLAKSKAEQGLGEIDLARASLITAINLDPKLQSQDVGSYPPKEKRGRKIQASLNSIAGLKAQERGDIPKAIELFNQALSTDDRDFVALYSLGIIAINAEDDSGLKILGKAVASDPTRPEGHYALGTAFMSKGLYEHAQTSLEKAIELDPAYEEAYVNKSTLLHSLKKNGEALETLNKALEKFPTNQKFLNNKGYLLTEQKLYNEAIETFQTLVKLNPNYENALGLLAHAKLHACDWKDLSPLSETIIKNTLEHKPACQPFALMSLSDDPAVLMQCAKQFGNHKFPAKHETLWNGEAYTHRKKRVAFLSADFREHAVGYLFKNILDELDSQEFELIAISSSADDGSNLYKYYKTKFHHYIESAGKTASEVARLIRALEVDIAIDLSGFTYGSRLDILAYRPAPIQITYLGYPGTLSLPYIDYIISDPITTPDEAGEYFSERIVRLNSCYLPGECRASLRKSRVEKYSLGLPEDKFILCSFNHDYKINPAMFAVWMKLMRDNKDSVLWLMKLNEPARTNLRLHAAHENVDPDRIYFASRVSTLDEHLSRYNVADLCLDTFPYNGHTTTYDALSMGVPVISLQGKSFQARVASSLLRDYQQEHNIACSYAEYYEKANLLITGTSRGVHSLPDIRASASKREKAYAFTEILRNVRALS